MQSVDGLEVYDPDTSVALRALSRGGSFCKQNQWGMEIALHDWFLACPCRTDDPLEADFFFVPHYTSCLINHRSHLPTSSRDGPFSPMDAASVLDVGSNKAFGLCIARLL